MLGERDVWRWLLHRLVAVVAGASLLAGCSTAEPRDELQVTETVTAAQPAVSPAVSTPAGTVVPLADKITAIVAVPQAKQLVLATSGAELRLLDLADPAAPPRTVPLPGPATALTATPDGVLASVSSAKQLVKVSLPAGTSSAQTLDGTPGAAAESGDLTLVPLSDRKAVDVVRAGKTQKQIAGSMFSADQVLTTGGNTVVLDRLRTAVFDINVAEGKVGAGQRAGQGATNATTDRFGRVLVTDTRGGALLAFATGPILLKQRDPVPGAPYGIAYDPKRDLAWVTLTERNEVIGYHVAGGEPTEKYRFPTVVQPNSVTVDPDSGRVFVASATGGGVQVMQP
jgi:DNA-binding beta-propeller fold protein YncE